MATSYFNTGNDNAIKNNTETENKSAINYIAIAGIAAIIFLFTIKKK